MAEKQHDASSKESHPLFCPSNASNQLGFGFGFGFGSGLFDAPDKPLPPPPPCIEVLPSEELSPQKSKPEPIVINDGLTLFKGRVSTFDVFGVSNSDLVPGKYEGGLKLWEGSVDLVKTLFAEIQQGQLSLQGKRVLELGCGHGLPGIYACLEGAAAVHFQDFNSEVLKCLTIPNVKSNLELLQKAPVHVKNDVKTSKTADVRFFAGDWSEIHQLLFQRCHHGPEKDSDISSTKHSSDGYDIILMAETVYALSSLQNLYSLIKKCLCHPLGAVYMAGKKHYFGVGGGTRQFRSLIEEDGAMEARLLAEVADGSSNLREVWKLSFK